jgi:hypothetical protein
MIVLYLLSIGIAWVAPPRALVSTDRRPQEATELPFGSIVSRPASLAGSVDPDGFLVLPLHLHDRRLPS